MSFSKEEKEELLFECFSLELEAAAGSDRTGDCGERAVLGFEKGVAWVLWSGYQLFFRGWGWGGEKLP